MSGGKWQPDDGTPSNVTDRNGEDREKVKRSPPVPDPPAKSQPNPKPPIKSEPPNPKLVGKPEPRILDWLPTTVRKTRPNFEIKTKVYFREIVEYSYCDYEVEGARYRVPDRKKSTLARKIASYNGMKSAQEIPAGKIIRLPRIYIVREGDNLTTISKRIYGDTRHVEEIFNANRDVVNDRNSVGIGWILILP